MTNVLIKREKLGYRHTGRRSHMKTEADIGAADTSQSDKDCWQLLGVRENQGRIFSLRLQKDHNPATTLMSDF